MPTFEITSPDGKTYIVDAPEGATREQALARVKAQVGAPEQATDVTPEQRNEIGREELGNPLEAGLVGAGRFASELGQGIKQKALMAGESMGLVDEGRADEYTEGVNEETQRWNELTKGAGAEDVGYYGAMMLPGAAIPGGGFAATAALGALETAAMPTEKAEIGDVAKQAALGGGTAGAFRAVPDAYRAGKGALNARKAARIDPDVAALAERGIKVSPDLYDPSVPKSVGRAAVELPVVSDVMRGKPMRRDAETLLKELSESNQTPDTIQDAFVKGSEKLKKADSDAWNTMWDESILPGENAMRIGDLPVDQDRLVNSLTNIASTPAERKALMKLGDLVPFEKGGMTLRSLHQLRANFAANKNWDDLGLSKKTQRKIYGSISEDMKKIAEENGGDRARNMMTNRIEDSKGMYTLLDQAKINRKAAAGNRIDNTPFVRAALGSSPDQRSAMKRIMAEEGAPAVRSQISSDILQAFQSDPAKAKRLIGKLNDPIREFFGPDEAALYRGLAKFIDNMPTQSGSMGSNLLTGGVAATAGATGMGVPAVMAGLMTSAMLRRKDIRAMLQKLSTAKPESKLAQELTKYIGLAVAGEGARQEPMQIDITNGRTP